MKEKQNYLMMSYDLLATATALAGILDQQLKGNCIVVNFQHACELIRDVQVSAQRVANELVYIEEERREDDDTL